MNETIICFVFFGFPIVLFSDGQLYINNIVIINITLLISIYIYIFIYL